MSVLLIVPLMPGHEGTRHHTFVVPGGAVSRMEAMWGVTHPRLSYFPDGGVASMRAYGCPVGRAAAAAVGGDGVAGRPPRLVPPPTGELPAAGLASPARTRTTAPLWNSCAQGPA
jgi:hypothetical protein